MIITLVALICMLAFDTNIMIQERNEGKSSRLDLVGIDVDPPVFEDKDKDKENLQQWDNNDETSSFTNLDGSPYNWPEHVLPGSKGLIYIHDQKVMKPPVGEKAQEWVRNRCQGFELDLEGIREGKCYKQNSHPLVSDQRICKATKSDASYRNNSEVWAVSETNPLHAEDMYTMVVPAFLRIDALVESMKTFAHCRELSSYHIVWGNPNELAPLQKIKETWLGATHGLRDRKPYLHVHLMSVDTLNNRYLDLPGINTKAVVHIDDDQTTNCKDMWRLLTTWRAYPQQIISPHVRAFSCNNREAEQEFTSISNHDTAKDMQFVYWGPIEKPFRGFECALTKFAMAHKCFSALFSFGMQHHQGHILAKEMVTRDLNGEDILFQGTASFATGLPPVFLQGIDIVDIGADDGEGISTRRKNDHFKARQMIVKDITKYLGFPWISQDFKIPKLLVTPDLKCPD